jgi:hypothetical protein
MFFLGDRRLFALKQLKARTALPRDTRPASLAIESLERRESLSGLVTNPAVLCGFNPQPDPPARAAQFGHFDSSTNGSQSPPPLHFDVPPGPC